MAFNDLTKYQAQHLLLACDFFPFLSTNTWRMIMLMKTATLTKHSILFDVLIILIDRKLPLGDCAGQVKEEEKKKKKNEKIKKKRPL